MKKKIKIGTCIKMTFAIVLLLMLATGVVEYDIADTAEGLGKNLYSEYGKSQGDVNMGLAYFQEVKCNLRNSLYLYADNSQKQTDAIKSIQTSQDNMNDSLDAAEKEIGDSRAQELLKDARKNIESYLEDVDTCISYINAGKIQDARTHLLNNGVDSANAALQSIKKLNSRLDKMAGTAQKEFSARRMRGNIISGVMILFCALCCLNGIYYLGKNISVPIEAITKAAGKVAKGEVDVDLSQRAQLREVAQLQEDFEEMIKNLKKQAEIMDQIANGDLRGSVQAHSQDDVTGNALARLLRDDNQIFNDIRNATNQISLGSGQIAAASQTLAQGSTEQASAIEQIAASVSDIADKTKNNASQADEVNRIVLEAKEDVSNGNTRMKEMVEAMNEINEASENIQKIIKVIDDIAFNTNILALNATVEAARAGEQGKGFAVVAEEVRNLAGRSAEASSQTAEMIEDSIEKVKRGGKLAQETAQALEVVSGMIEQITGLSQNIAKASNEQASATAQIDEALMQVSQVVQTNSATSQQCASASEELSGQARGLNKELARFRLKDVVGNMPSQTLEYAEPEMLENNMKY